MCLNLFARLIVLLVLLISTGLTDTGCFTSGNTWSDIGDDEDIKGAFKTLCGGMAGNYTINETVENCVDVKNHRVDASITILDTENSSFTQDAELYEEVCEMLLSKAKSDCNDKGGLMNEFANLGPEFHKYGFIIGEVMADPNRGHC